MSYADHMISKASADLAEAERTGDRSRIRAAKTAISRWEHIRAVVDGAPEFTPELKGQLRGLVRRPPLAPVMPLSARRTACAPTSLETTAAAPVGTRAAA